MRTSMADAEQWTGGMMLCAVVLALGCGGGGGGGPTNPNNQNQNPTVTVPASFVSGTWGGQAAREVGQLNLTPYPLTVTFSGANSVKVGTTMATTAAGPFVGLVGTCAGTLAFQDLAGRELTLSARVQSGPCVDLGTVTLLYNADPPTSIRYGWSRPGAGADSGTLTKR